MAGNGSILTFPLEPEHGKRVKQLIKTLSAVSLKGGGKVPLQVILEIAHWDKKAVGVRVAKSRSDLMLKSKQGQLQGTFMNTGKPMKELVDDLPMMKPELIIGRRVDGYFQIQKEVLTLHHMRGLSVLNTVGEDMMSFTVKVKQVIISPDGVALV